MSHKVIVSVYAFLFILTLFPACGQEIGKILQTTGDVQLDSQGTALFQKAEKNAPLFFKSVIKTAAQSTALISLYDHEILVPAASVTPVIMYASEFRMQEKIGARHYATLLDHLTRALADLFGDYENKEYGLKETKPNTSTQPEWFQEEELYTSQIKAQLAQAKKAFLNRDYKASASLTNFIIPEKEIFLAYRGETLFLKGLCYLYQNELLFADHNFAMAYHIVSDYQDKIAYYKILLFTSGLCTYLLAKPVAAIASFKEYLATKPADELSAYAYLLIAQALLETKQTAPAAEYLRTALKLYPTGSLSATFDNLLKKISSFR